MLYPESLIKRDFENKRKANKKRIEKSMSEWKEYKLGDLYDVHNGLSKGRKFFGSGYPFLSFKTVFNNYFLPPKLSELVQANEKEQKGYNIKRGDVFVTRTSETPEELGMSSVALKDYPFATYNGFTKRLRPKDMSLVCPEFIGYYLRSPKFRALFYGLASSMSTRASLVNGDLLGMSVFLPSFETQERIASLLSSLDDKISVNKKICENLEAQAQALFKHWFIDFAPFKDGKFVESELGMIPEGWRVGRLGEIAEFKRGSTITKSDTIEGEIPVVAGGLEPAYYHNKSNTSSRVITVRGSGANAGFTRMYFQPVWASDCSFVDNESTSYLHTAFCFLLVYKKKVDALKWGAAQPHVYAKDINKLSFAIPQIDVLSHFEELVTPFFDYMEKCKRESSRLSTLRDTLLPRLMSGEIKL